MLPSTFFQLYSSPTLIDHPSVIKLPYKTGITGVASLEGDNLVVFYYLGASKIWPDKRGGLWWKWPYKRDTTIM